MPFRVCPKCQRSVEPLERLEKDKKAKKTWQITYCPYERCNFNFDIEPMNIKIWNANGHFEDYTL